MQWLNGSSKFQFSILLLDHPVSIINIILWKCHLSNNQTADLMSLFSLFTEMIKQILLINFHKYFESLIHIHCLKIKLFISNQIKLKASPYKNRTGEMSCIQIKYLLKKLHKYYMGADKLIVHK